MRTGHRNRPSPASKNQVGTGATVACASQANGGCSRDSLSPVNEWAAGAGAMAQAAQVWQSSALVGIWREAVDAVITGPA